MNLNELIISDVADMVSATAAELGIDPAIAVDVVGQIRREASWILRLASRQIREEDTLMSSFPEQVLAIEEQSFAPVLYEDELPQAALNAATLLYMVATPQPKQGINMGVCLS